MAPSTIPKRKNEIKTDKRDAEKLAKCLAYGSYSKVNIPTKEDLLVKEYIRMRDDHKLEHKRIKQQIIALCTRHGFIFDGKSNWTQKHMKWLHNLGIEGTPERQ